MKAGRSWRFQADCWSSITFRIAWRAASVESWPVLATVRAAMAPMSKSKSRIRPPSKQFRIISGRGTNEAMHGGRVHFARSVHQRGHEGTRSKTREQKLTADY